MQAESQSALSCKRSFQQGSSFLLPDLNMPLDTDMSPEVICWINGEPWAYYSFVFPSHPNNYTSFPQTSFFKL